jgi:outer membrane protein OmpA-like peptidoglycan-associated protein
VISRTIARSLTLPVVLLLGAGCAKSTAGGGTAVRKSTIAASVGAIPADHPGWWINHVPPDTTPVATFVSDEIFNWNDDKLQPGADAVLRKGLPIIGTGRGPVYELTGHADLVGCEGSRQVQVCIDLTERRAAAARQWFIDHGVPPERIKARGAGALSPRTLDPAKQAENRRIELRVAG